jgi:hypothetical protein
MKIIVNVTQAPLDLGHNTERAHAQWAHALTIPTLCTHRCQRARTYPHPSSPAIVDTIHYTCFNSVVLMSLGFGLFVG